MKEHKLTKLEEDEDTVTYSISENEGEEQEDTTGTLLLALSDLTSMSDDLYTMIGEGREITSDEADSVLSAYDLISELHDRYDDVFSMPSQGYDLDDYDIEVMEALEEDTIEEGRRSFTELKDAELIAWIRKNNRDEPGMSHVFGQQILAAKREASRRKLSWKLKEDTIEEATSSFTEIIKKHGFSLVKDFKLKRPYRVKTAYGLKMRAGKWADTFIGELESGSGNYTHFIKDGEDEYYYLSELQFANAFNKVTNEEVELDEEVNKQKLRDKIASLKAALKDISVKKNDPNYTDKYDPQSRIYHNKRLKEIPNEINTLRRKLLGEEVELDESFTVSTWQEQTGVIAKFRLSVMDMPGNDVAKILDKIMPNHKVAFTHGVEVGFSFKSDRNAAAKALEKYMTNGAKAKSESFEELDETPDSSAMAKLNKVRMSIKGYREKLAKAKENGNIAMADDLMKIIAKLEKDRDALKKQVGSSVKENYVITQGSTLSSSLTDVSSRLSNLLEDVQFTSTDDSLSFNSIEECKSAAEELVNYYTSVLEESATHIDLDVLVEEFDENKFRRLAITGLVSDSDTAKIIRAMKNLQTGKTLDATQKNLIADTFMNLIGIVTGDTSIFNKVQSAVKS